MIGKKDRILILTVFIMIFWLAAIDVVVAAFFKAVITSSLKRETEIYLNLYNQGLISKLPSYMVISPKMLKENHPLILNIGKDKHVYVNAGYIKKVVKRFMFTLLLWELALTFTVVLFVYVILRIFYDREKKFSEMLRFVLLAVSHKLGNFIAAQRINLEMLREDKALERIKSSMNEIEKEFYFLTEALNSISENNSLKERVNLRAEIESILSSYLFKGLDKKLNLVDVWIKVNEHDLKMVLNELLNNAFKYAKTFIKISIEDRNRRIKLYIENDIKDSPVSSSGLGGVIVEYLCRRNSWIITRKIKEDTYTVVLIIFK